MKRLRDLSTLAGTVALAVLCVYFSSPNHFSRPLVWTSSLALGIGLYSTSRAFGFFWQDPNSVKKIVTLGPRLSSAVTSLISGIIAVISAQSSTAAVSRISDVFALIFSAMSIFGTTKIGAKVEEIDNRINVKSQHFTWRADLERISLRCEDFGVREEISNLSGEMQFVASDQNGEGSQVDGDIEGAIASLRSAVLTSDYATGRALIVEIRSLVKEREILLKESRR